MSIKILRAGLLSTIQDLGRFGYQQYGVIVGGAMDTFAHRLGNILVGNREQEGTLEITMFGPVLQFNEDRLISICGADLNPSIEGFRVPLWKAVLIRKGSILSFKGSTKGCRAYLAVVGGFDLPKVFGSKSTYLRAGIGGLKGRALKEGDLLELGNPSQVTIKLLQQVTAITSRRLFEGMNWGIAPSIVPTYESNLTVRIIAGKEAPLFETESWGSFLNSSFRITSQSDRMGYRLEGVKLSLKKPFELISEGVTFGTVQVPPNGKPIILMADRQTTGGYPRIAQIASVDLTLVAQAKPGDLINFREISLKEAQRLYIEREKEIKQISFASSLQLGGGVK